MSYTCPGLMCSGALRCLTRSRVACGVLLSPLSSSSSLSLSTPPSQAAAAAMLCGSARRGFYDKIRSEQRDGASPAGSRRPHRQHGHSRRTDSDEDEDGNDGDVTDKSGAALLQRKYGSGGGSRQLWSINSVVAWGMLVLLTAMFYTTWPFGEPPLDRCAELGMRHPLMQQQQQPPRRV